MKWKNAARDTLPSISGPVLLSYKGVYHIGLYNKELNEFTIETQETKIVIHSSDQNIYWSELFDATMKSPFTILIADDDEDDHEIMKIELQKINVNVEISSVFDGAQALDYLYERNEYKGSAKRPDILLLDLNMPKIDGFSVLREIKAHNELKSLPVYVVTTSRNLQDWKKAKEMGANGYYNKGSSSMDMARIIKEISDHFKKTQ